MADYLNDKDAVFFPLNEAVEHDAYDYLTKADGGWRYIDAIRETLINGARPEDIRAYMLKEVGVDRMGLALRCSQAASHIFRTEFNDRLEEVNKPVITQRIVPRTKGHG